MNATEQVAQELKTESSALVGFDIMTIMTLIQGLIALFQACKKTDAGPTPEAGQSAKEFLDEQYDGNEYSPFLVSRAAARTYRTARRKGHKMTHQEARDATVAMFDKCRQGDDATVGSVFAENPEAV